MRTPHKHAALIKAWADGAEIEVRNEYHEWTYCEYPSWYYAREYRIKPEVKTIKYRRYLWRNTGGCPNVFVLNEGDASPSPAAIERISEFIRWIDDEWQEVSYEV